MMGMFDNIVDTKLVCPFCGSNGDLEIQTKDFECMMQTYYVTYKGENPSWLSTDKITVPDKLARVDGIAVCHSAPCFAIERMRDIMKRGYISGFSRSFKVCYNVSECKIVGPATIDIDGDTDTYPMVRAAFVECLSKNEALRIAFKEQLEKYNEYGLAILDFHYCPNDGFKVIHPGEMQ